ASRPGRTGCRNRGIPSPVAGWSWPARSRTIRRWSSSCEQFLPVCGGSRPAGQGGQALGADGGLVALLAAVDVGSQVLFEVVPSRLRRGHVLAQVAAVVGVPRVARGR